MFFYFHLLCTGRCSSENRSCDVETKVWMIQLFLHINTVLLLKSEYVSKVTFNNK